MVRTSCRLARRLFTGTSQDDGSDRTDSGRRRVAGASHMVGTGG